MDLQFGLKVYGKNIRSLFCVSTASGVDVVSTFVDEQLTASQASDVDALIATYADSNKLAAIDKAPEVSQANTDAGYSAGDAVLGYRMQGPDVTYFDPT